MKPYARNSLLLGGRSQYSDKVLATDPIAYWLLDEKQGAVAYDSVAVAQNGAYTGVTLGQPGIGDGRTSPLYDGVNDYTNVQSVAFAAAFDGDAGSILAWARVLNAGVWIDGTVDTIVRLEADGNNFVQLRKTGAANQIQYIYKAGGVTEASNIAFSSTNWFCMAGTWERPGNWEQYLDGVPVATDAIGGVWAGALAISLLGSAAPAPVSPWNGWLVHCAVWDRPLSPAEIADLAVIE